jgi:hypothetical protein
VRRTSVSPRPPDGLMQLPRPGSAAPHALTGARSSARSIQRGSWGRFSSRDYVTQPITPVKMTPSKVSHTGERCTSSCQGVATGVHRSVNTTITATTNQHYGSCHYRSSQTTQTQMAL